MQFKKPRGTRDFLPREMANRKHVENQISRVFENYGYKEIRTPTFEHLELITAKSGEEIKDHLYHFKDKSERDIALRPELTAPVMRLYVNELQQEPKPHRLYYFGNCFRYERTQSGRYREFWQIGAEQIGSPYPEADAEILSLAADSLKAIGLEDYEIHIGHIGILKGILKNTSLSEEQKIQILRTIDKGIKDDLVSLLDDLGLEDSIKKILLNLIGMAGKREEIVPRAREAISGIPDVVQDLEKFEDILNKLESFGTRDYIMDLGIARGLDYYTGMVFEIYAHRLGAEKQICGGGSYSLTEVFGGRPTPTTGFAFGFDRLVLALEKEGKGQEETQCTRFLVLATSPDLADRAIEISSILRVKYPTELDIMRKKLKKTISYANSRNIPYLILVGEEELERGSIIIKDMEKAEQKEVRISNLLEEVSQLKG